MELQGDLFCEKWTIFHITSGKIKISLSNRFGVFLPRFRSLNGLYKHLDGLGVLLGSPNGGQLKKSDSESLTLQHNQLLSPCPITNCHLFERFLALFSSILNTFLAYLSQFRPHSGAGCVRSGLLNVFAGYFNNYSSPCAP